MNVAVRYQSRGGHVKAMAESLAEGAGVEAISVDAPNAALDEHVDLLFIGGAMYKWKLDPTMVEFLESIPEGSVYKAIVFGSSLTTRRPVYSIQEMLRAKGVEIHPLALFQRGRPKKYLFEIAPPFARDQVKEVQKELAEKAEELGEQAAEAAQAAEKSSELAAARAQAAAAAADELAAGDQEGTGNNPSTTDAAEQASAEVPTPAQAEAETPDATAEAPGAAVEARAAADELAQKAAEAAAEAERLQALAAEARAHADEVAAREANL